MKKLFLSTALLLVLSLSFTSCRETKKAESVEDVIENVGDAIESAAETTGDAVEAVDSAIDTTGDAINNSSANE